jgi:Zn-finger protein
MSDYKFKGFTNEKCEFFPCHEGVKRSFNCMFCYCPLLHLECPGPYKVITSKYGRMIKDCSDCTLPHDGIDSSWKFIQRWLPVAPRWGCMEQTPEKIARFSKQVNLQFDIKDIKWAEQQV